MVRLEHRHPGSGRIPVLDAEILDRIERRENSDCVHLWDILDEVKDPEIPVLSIWDLGVLRNVESKNSRITVVITPTYSGCPAMQTIEDDIVACLHEHGYSDVHVVTRLAPAWTTDWMSDTAHERLRSYGIAAPVGTSSKLSEDPDVSCPNCGSNMTRRISEFGSTACKALYKCNDCQEPFDYFKCI